MKTDWRTRPSRTYRSCRQLQPCERVRRRCLGPARQSRRARAHSTPSRHRSADAGRRVAIAMRPDGVRTGLIAAKTASGACTTSTPDLSSIWATRPSSVSDAIRDDETAASSKEWPDSCASRTRCTPSRSTRAPAKSAESASARNRATMGFCRLVMERISWLVDRGWLFVVVLSYHHPSPPSTDHPAHCATV